MALWMKPLDNIAQTTIFEQYFDVQIPSEFLLYNDDHPPHISVVEYTNAWIFKHDPHNPNNGTASTTSYFASPQQANRWLVSPPITLGNTGNKLAWSGKSHDASFAESYRVLLSETTNDRTSFTDTLITVNYENTEWTAHSIDLSQKGYDAKTVFVAFVLISVDGYKFYLDSLHISSDNAPDPNPNPDPNPPIPPPVILDIQELDQLPTMHIFPNPASRSIHVISDSPINSISIRSTTGHVVRQAQDQLIDVQQLAPGVYFVEINTTHGRATQRFIKE